MSRAPTDPTTGAAAASLRPVVSDAVERSGFVLDDLEVRPVGRRLLVRVTVDTAEVPGVEDGPAGSIDLDAVAAVSRDVSASVDAHEETAGAALDAAWTLEVSTPGTDRPLRTPHHWRRAWLRRVAVTLTDRSTLSGRVGGVEGDGGDTDAAVTLFVDGATRIVPLAEVARAVVEVEFKPAPDAEVDALRAGRRAAGPTGGTS